MSIRAAEAAFVGEGAAADGAKRAVGIAGLISRLRGGWRQPISRAGLRVGIGCARAQRDDCRFQPGSLGGGLRRTDSPQQQFHRVDRPVSLRGRERLVVRPPVADVPQFARVVRHRPGQIACEWEAVFAEPFRHCPQHQRQIAAPVHAHLSASGGVLAAQQLGPGDVRRQRLGGNVFDERGKAIDQYRQSLTHHGVKVGLAHDRSPS